MKQSLIKKISYIACCTMLAGAVGATAVYAANENTASDTAEEAPAVSEETEEETDEAEKDETVYVLANANGGTNKIIVSDHLINAGSDSLLTETSSLRDVENVKGDETFTEDGDTRKWNAAGKDIYYRGTSNDELPIDMKITYTLDGEEMSADQILGKSGHVTIRFDYTNNKYEDVTINGEKSKIYVPFAAITGLMLDNSKFSGIEVTNAKKINDGDRTFIVGTAFPGLTESLDVSTDKITIPDYVEISADVTDFELANTVTIATNEVFNNIDLDLGDKEETITEDIDKLSDAMNRLTDGSAQLHDGLETLLEKTSGLSEGTGALRDGAEQLKDGAAKADDGAVQLKDGAVQLSAGLEKLTDSNESLTAGSEQVFNSLLDMANTQLEAAGITGYKLTIGNYAETLDKIIASLDGDNALKTAQETARKQVTAAVEEKRSLVEAEVTKAVTEQVTAKVNEGVKAAVTEKVTEAVKGKVFEGVLAAKNMTPEKYQQGVAAGMIDETTQKALEAAVAQQMQTPEVQAQITAAVDQQMQSPEVKAQADGALKQQLASDDVKAIIKQTTDDKIKELVEENMKSDEVQNKISEGAGAAKAGAKKLSDLKAQLDSYNTFYTGLAQYTDGVAQASEGAKKLDDGLGELGKGTAALKDGSAQLCDGIAQLDDSVPALTDGIRQLADGSGELSDGINKFNEEGVSKIVSLAEGDLGKAIDRLKAISDVSERYETFTGGNGNVKFIYRTDAVEK